MALKFKLQGLAETFIDKIVCPNCSAVDSEDKLFTTDLTKVTLIGIVVVARCNICGEIFIPDRQRLGVVEPRKLKEEVKRDSQETGEPILADVNAVRLYIEKLKAQYSNSMH